MKRDPLVTQDALTASILTFLEDNADRSYTVKELAMERYTFSSKQQLQKSIEVLLRRGSLKVRSRGTDIAYQIVPIK